VAVVELHTLKKRPADGYAAAVIGAPMILGWHREARRFVHEHQVTLSKMPVAYFVTAMALTQTEETQVDGVPVSIDPVLAKAPQRAGKLSLREGYTQVKRYVRPLPKPHWVAGQHAPVQGSWIYRLKILPMLFTAGDPRSQGLPQLPVIRPGGLSLLLDHPESEQERNYDDDIMQSWEQLKAGVNS
jgi:hypothetical protein